MPRILYKSVAPIVLVLGFATGLFTCVNWANKNPYLPDYESNGYKLIVDTTMIPRYLFTGDTLVLPCTTGVAPDTFESVKLASYTNGNVTMVHQRSDSAPFVSLTFDSAFSGKVTLIGKRPNGRLDSASFTVTVLPVEYKGSFPAPKLSNTLKSFTKNDTIKLVAPDTFHKAKIWYWQFDTSAIRSTTTDTLRMVFPNVDTVHLKIWAEDSLGFRGNTWYDTLYIRSFVYTINTLSLRLPDTVRVGRETIFLAQVDSSDRFTRNNGKYQWKFKRNNVPVLDTIETSRKLTYTFPDSALSWSISVIAYDDQGGASSILNQLLVSRTFRPFCALAELSGRDTTIRITVPLMLTLHAYDTDPDSLGHIDSAYWDFNGDALADTVTTALSMVHTWYTNINTSVLVWVKDRDGWYSNVDTVQVTVSNAAPYLSSPRRDSAFLVVPMNRQKVLREPALPAFPSRSVVRWHWKLTGAFQKDTITPCDSLNVPFGNPGLCTVTVSCKDIDSIVCAKPDTFVVDVQQFAPIITGVILPQFYLYQDSSVTIQALDNGSITSFYTALSLANLTVPSASNKVNVRFFSAGVQHIYVKVKDDDNNFSVVKDTTVFVDSGKPSMSFAIWTDPDSTVYINDSPTLRLRASDVNGHIDSFAIIWPNGVRQKVTASNPGDSASVTHTFLYSDSGMSKIVRIVAFDNDAFRTDTLIKHITVLIGRPRVLAISTKRNLDSLFINDLDSLIFSFADTNGYVDSIKIDTGKGLFTPWLNVNGQNQYLKTRRFSRSEVGPRIIRAVAKDNVGLISDTARDTFTVLLGQPVVDSISPKTTWINDDSTYTIFAHDIHGTIQKRFWDLDNNGTWDDSAISSSIITFPGHFPSAGIKQVRLGVRDDDTLLTVDTFPVNVRLGKPRVWNPSGDTLFVVTPAGGGNINIPISSSDSNGTIQKYYWKFNQPFDTVGANQTATDSIYRNFIITAPLLNNAFQMAAFGKDDDGLVAGDTLWLYPDGPPASPDTVSPSKNASVTGSVKFIWQNVDMHDQAFTQYQILCDDNATPIASISNYQSGTSYASEGTNRFSYTKSLSGAGVKFWRVLAKDSRGSVVQGPISWFIYTP